MTEHISTDNSGKILTSTLWNQSGKVVVQINGKVRAVVKVPADASQDAIVEIAKENEEVAKYITGDIVKVIYVPKKILNIIVK